MLIAMHSRRPNLRSVHAAALVLLCLNGCPITAQQVVQRGAFGKPAQVLDDTGQWTTPLPLVSDADVQIYMPDVSSSDWLKQNYASYRNQGTYTLTVFTFYKTPSACRANQIAWGLGDAAHLDACNSIAYRVHRTKIDPHSRSVILLEAAMTDSNGNVLPALVEKRSAYRSWDQLDANSLKAVKKADDLVAAQMKIYDEKQNGIR